MVHRWLVGYDTLNVNFVHKVKHPYDSSIITLEILCMPFLYRNDDSAV